MNAAGSDAGAAAAAGGGAKPAKVSKPRLPSLDSLRFFLIAYIGVGHFVAFATKDAFLLKLFSQVLAGAAFEAFAGRG
jgi:peptidoglycan/LPS O-acetylase OafA/YrhL